MIDPQSTVNEAMVVQTLRALIAGLPKDVADAFHLSVDSARKGVGGDWIARVICDASDAMASSYELHRLLNRLQQLTEDELGETVTLLPAA